MFDALLFLLLSVSFKSLFSLILFLVVLLVVSLRMSLVLVEVLFLASALALSVLLVFDVIVILVMFFEASFVVSSFLSPLASSLSAMSDFELSDAVDVLVMLPVQNNQRGLYALVYLVLIQSYIGFIDAATRVNKKAEDISSYKLVALGNLY